MCRKSIWNILFVVYKRASWHGYVYSYKIWIAIAGFYKVVFNKQMIHCHRGSMKSVINISKLWLSSRQLSGRWPSCTCWWAPPRCQAWPRAAPTCPWASASPRTWSGTGWIETTAWKMLKGSSPPQSIDSFLVFSFLMTTWTCSETWGYLRL